MQTAFLKLMLDPASYCHPSRLPLEVPQSLQAALNRSLMRQYCLTVPTYGVLSSLEREVLSAWFCLRRCAYLIGAYRRRNAVLQQLGFQACDPVLQKFLMLPLSSLISQDTQTGVSEADLLQSGAEVLEPWLRPLPQAWRARAALLFPAAVDLSSPRADALNRPLISMGLHHAKTA